METFNYSLVPRCLVEATEVALLSYITPILYLSGHRSGASEHKVKVGLIHETAIALAVFQHVLMHPELLEHRYDVRWEHSLTQSHGSNVPSADLYFSPAQGAAGVKTWIEMGDLGLAKVRKDARKLVKHRKNDALFLLLLDLTPPANRTSQEAMHKRIVNLATKKVPGCTFATNAKACRLLTLPIAPLDKDSSPVRLGFGLVKVAPS
jgi:hypothetical protein